MSNRTCLASLASLAGIVAIVIAAIPAKSMFRRQEASPPIVRDSAPSAPSAPVDGVRSVSTELSEETDPYAAYYYCASESPTPPGSPRPQGTVFVLSLTQPAASTTAPKAPTPEK
jgi:hypothetical protein